MSGIPRSGITRELLRLLQPPTPRRARLLSERIAPALAEVGRTHRGRPVDEVFTALAEVVTAAGGTPDATALREFADQVEAGQNPFD
ncbi:MAG: hypothetical protein JWQ26_444 [Modestobacter sp.]|nr:hypothetical protein [Modestobacter sp.]